MIVIALVVAQAAALALLLVRLSTGRHRRPPVPPLPAGIDDTSVTVLLPSYNEARRIAPCLAALGRQGSPVHQIIVVDSRSDDGTDDLVRAAARQDPRITMINDPPLPVGWVGKVWALQHGLRYATGEWVLGVDADTESQPGMVAGAVAAAREYRYDVVSFAPRFADMSATEQWLQPSMLLTLVYRFGAAGIRDSNADRLMANGQCFLARRDVLQAHGGYEVARTSWADDVSLARYLARRGVRVGFLDGAHLYDVRAYTGVVHMWREWGRSFDLSDATTRSTQWLDVAFILLAQGLPLGIVGLFLAGLLRADDGWSRALVALNGVLLAIRLLMVFALRDSYRRRTIGFWLSPLSDPIAVLRLLLSTVRRPRQWRGRRFAVSPVAPRAPRPDEPSS
ncbi:MAG: glycosyltransferase [Gemmatimonadaceae bacterium]